MPLSARFEWNEFRACWSRAIDVSNLLVTTTTYTSAILSHLTPTFTHRFRRECHVGSSSFQVYVPMHVHDEPSRHPSRVCQALWQGPRECGLRRDEVYRFQGMLNL